MFVNVRFMQLRTLNCVAKIFSGTFSDWLGRRKPLMVAGYGLAALSKPLFPLAGDVATVLMAKFIDRLGKGIRDAPRDALLADQLPSNARGSGFGLRLTLFTIGSVLGPLIASGIMVASGGDFRLAFWVAVIPAVLSVAVLVSAVYGLTAYPCGILADRVNRGLQFGVGVMVLLCGHVALATADTIWMAALGTVLWGLQMGITQGLLAASVADAAPEHLRGTAFGIFYLVDGVTSLLASSGAGVLWMIGGSAMTFGIGAALAAAALFMLLARPLPRVSAGPV